MDPVAPLVGNFVNGEGRAFMEKQPKPAITPSSSKSDILAPGPVNPLLAISLTLYAYFLGSMFFAPIIPGLIVLLVYIVVVEAITWVTYYLLKWEWSVYTRVAIVVATFLGYLVGMGIYKTSTYLISNRT